MNFIWLNLTFWKPCSFRNKSEWPLTHSIPPKSIRKPIRKPKVLWCFQGVQKKSTNTKWIKLKIRPTLGIIFCIKDITNWNKIINFTLCLDRNFQWKINEALQRTVKYENCSISGKWKEKTILSAILNGQLYVCTNSRNLTDQIQLLKSVKMEVAIRV